MLSRFFQPRLAGLATGAVLLLAAAGPVWAADAAGPILTPTGSGPAAGAAADPAASMSAIVTMLERDAGHVALMVETIPITQGDAAEYIRTMPPSISGLGYKGVFKQAMDALVRQKAILLLARKEGLDKDPGVIHRAAILSDKAISDAWLTERGNKAVTEQALHARYDQTIAGRPGPDEVRARIILCSSLDEGRDLIARIQGGADFAELARKASRDGTAAEGGDLGYLVLEAASPELGSVMFSLAPGQMTAFPINTFGGYVVLRVEGRRQRATPSFEEARPGLERALRSEGIRTAVATVMDGVKVTIPAAPGDGTGTTKKP